MVTARCDRCGDRLDLGEHGLYRCPLEPRRAVHVRPDAIPGGRWLYHGLCHADGTPKRYDSESAITRACAEQGLTRWTDIHEERSLNGAREHSDWLKSGEAQRERAGRVELRRQKAARR